jgi:iron complex transport system permease protein
MKNIKLTSDIAVYLIVTLLSLFAIFFMTFFGAADITFIQTVQILLNKIFWVFKTETEQIPISIATIIWKIRFPRTLLAFVSGGALASCGGVYQAIFKNPMADPFILGISSGAAFGATIAIVLKIPATYMGLNATSFFAFAGSIITVFAVYNIARIGRQTHLTSLLLTGTALSQFLTATISIGMLISEATMKNIYFWTLGSFNSKGWDHLKMVLPYIATGYVLVSMHAKDLDIIMLGDDTAIRFGVESEKIKQRLFFVTALMMSAVVSVSGIIGFVGLIAPHIVRLFTGPIHRKLFPVSFAVGGIMLCVCDTIARSATMSEIPVGIVTAIIGAPFFIYLLRAKRTEVA